MYKFKFSNNREFLVFLDEVFNELNIGISLTNLNSLNKETNIDTYTVKIEEYNVYIEITYKDLSKLSIKCSIKDMFNSFVEALIVEYKLTNTFKYNKDTYSVYMVSPYKNIWDITNTYKNI